MRFLHKFLVCSTVILLIYNDLKCYDIKFKYDFEACSLRYVVEGGAAILASSEDPYFNKDDINMSGWCPLNSNDTEPYL